MALHSFISLQTRFEVTMDMPFALADNEAIKVFRVDSDKL